MYLRKIFALLTFFILSFLLWVWFSTSHFAPVEMAEIQCLDSAPFIDLTKTIKILTWNIQFLAGKNYIFFFDAADGLGKDQAPSLENTKITLQEINRVVRDENPDFLLLQEVDVGAHRTYYQNQVALLKEQLTSIYPCVASTYYWKAQFLPHPKIMGSVGMKLVIFSKYKIEKALRYALGEFPSNIIDRQFRPKRAVLEAWMPSSQNTSYIHILNTHLEAYSQGSDLLKTQVDKISKILNRLETTHSPWILGGDFNLLMPGRSYFDLSPTQRSYYQESSELEALTKQFSVIPKPEDINDENIEHRKKWFTHFPNDPEVKSPDRTIDYIFFSKNIHAIKASVRSQDTLKISDHLPVVLEFSMNRK